MRGSIRRAFKMTSDKNKYECNDSDDELIIHKFLEPCSDKVRRTKKISD